MHRLRGPSTPRWYSSDRNCLPLVEWMEPWSSYLSGHPRGNLAAMGDSWLRGLRCFLVYSEASFVSSIKCRNKKMRVQCQGSWGESMMPCNIKINRNHQILTPQVRWISPTLLMKSAASTDHPRGISCLFIWICFDSMWSLISFLLLPTYGL